MPPYSMFGTIRLNPDHRTSDFVKSADGDLYGQLGGKLPRHRACDRCRAKKTKCSGDEPGCRQCKEQATRCVYSASSSSGAKGAGRRRREAGLEGGSRKLGGSRCSAATTTKRPRLGNPVRRGEPPAVHRLSPVPGWSSCPAVSHDTNSNRSEDLNDGKLLVVSDNYGPIRESGSSDVDVASNLSEHLQQLEAPESPSNILDLPGIVTSHHPELAADDYATTPSIPESGPSPSSDYNAFFDLADLAPADGPHDDDPVFYDDLCPNLGFDPTADWGEEFEKQEWAAVKTPAALLLHLVPAFAPPTCKSCTCTHSSYSSLLSTNMDDMDDFMLVRDDDAFPAAPSPFSLLPDTTTTTPPSWETGTTTPDTMEPLTPPYSVAASTTTTTTADSTAVCTCASSVVAWDLLDELDRRI